MEGDLRSSYSISASARAVLQWMHQCTGLLPFVGVPGREERGQEAKGLRLIFRLHGQVGVVPLAEDAEADELGPLDVDELQGVFPAFLPDLDEGHVLLFRAEELVDVDLDGQAVAIPAGDVGRDMPLHAPGLDDEILEDLVQGRAQVDMPVGIGGAVVEDERGPAGFLPRFQDLPVQVLFLPFPDGLGLFLGEGRLHGKGGPGQVQRALDVFLVGHRELQFVGSFPPL